MDVKKNESKKKLNQNETKQDINIRKMYLIA